MDVPRDPALLLPAVRDADHPHLLALPRENWQWGMDALTKQDNCGCCCSDFTFYATGKASIEGGRAKDRYPHNAGIDRVKPGVEGGRYAVNPLNMQWVSNGNTMANSHRSRSADTPPLARAPSWTASATA